MRILVPRNYPSRRLLACIARANGRTIYRTRFRRSPPFPFTSSTLHHGNFSPLSTPPSLGRFRVIRSSHHPQSLIPPYTRRRVCEVCDSPLPRGANYIVRNVNLVCQAVSAREGSLTSLDGTCTSLAITALRDEEISSYSWEHPTSFALSALSTNTRSIRV